MLDQDQGDVAGRARGAARSAALARRARARRRGSSSMMILGSVTSRHRRAATWRCSPWESEPTTVSSLLAEIATRPAASRARSRSSGRACRARPAGAGRRSRRRRRGRCCPRRSGRGTAATAGRCARARASRARAPASGVTSWPKSSIAARRDGEVAGDDVEERRLAGAVRAEDAAPFTGRDVEIDVSDGEQAAEAPADPPQAEDRPAFSRFGLRFVQARYLISWFVTTPFLTTLILPCHGVFVFLQGGWVRPGGGLLFVKRPPNDWSRSARSRRPRSPSLPSAFLTDLQRLLVLDRLAVRVETGERRRSTPGSPA